MAATLHGEKKQMTIFPELISNLIAGAEVSSSSLGFPNINPSNGETLNLVSQADKKLVQQAIKVASDAQPAWAAVPAVERGNILFKICRALEDRSEEIAFVVATETGKILKDAKAETYGAISLARFFSGEGQRLFGRSIPSSIPNKFSTTVRQPCGVAALIVASNTPIANICWKVFPALICGNSVVLKGSEDAPMTAWLFTKIMHETGLPTGCLNLINGPGEDVGKPLVDSPEIDVLSFTGSSKIGKSVALAAAKNLTKVSLELGGKNPLVICDDANLESAVKWTCLSSFSNAGQRCSSASRVIVFAKIYDEFKNRLIEATNTMKLGIEETDDLGPVINKRQMDSILASISKSIRLGATLSAGGTQCDDKKNKDGFFINPTILENLAANDPINDEELFGPVAQLYRVENFEAAMQMANSSQYGLTAAIHTKNIDRAMSFCSAVRAGVVTVNGGTHGSEPHMPFGGVGQSGNGTREPGTEALDIYSDLKNICQIIDPNLV